MGGSPHIFFTKSAYESKMIELIQSLLEKDKNKLMTPDDVLNLSAKEINDLLYKYPIDVTYHLDARFRNVLNQLKKSRSLGDYKVTDQFYRVEFQQKGSAHVHCIFWISDDDGNPPPSISLNNTDNDEAYKEYFSSIVSATS